MSKKGYVKLHRQLQDHWLNKQRRVYSQYEAWIDIIMEVNHTDQKVPVKDKIIICKRGESLKSLDTWAKRWKWNKSKVRRFFKLLQDDGMILLKSDAKTTHLTVCNYDSYQDSRNDDETIVKRSRNDRDTKQVMKKNERKNEREKSTPTGFIFRVGGDDVFSLRQYLDEHFQIFIEGKRKSFGEHFVNKAIDQFQEENNEKAWKDEQDFRSHFSHYLKNLRLNNWQPKAKEEEAVQYHIVRVSPQREVKMTDREFKYYLLSKAQKEAFRESIN